MSVICVSTASAVLLTGCGTDEKATTTATTTTDGKSEFSLTLDFSANAVHAGIAHAIRSGKIQQAGLQLTVKAPASGADGLKLVTANKSDLAIVPLHDLSVARNQGSSLQAIGAIVQRPLGSLIASKTIKRPRNLEGKTIGVTGLPSDEAVVNQIINYDGGHPNKVKMVTIGFEAVKSLLSKKVDAATGFWNAEGVAISKRRKGTKVFRVDDFGAPSYPELVIVGKPDLLNANQEAVKKLLSAIKASEQEIAALPEDQLESVVTDLKQEFDKTIDPATTLDQLKAVRSSFVNADNKALDLDMSLLRKWAKWEEKTHLVRIAPDTTKLVWDQVQPASTKTVEQSN